MISGICLKQGAPAGNNKTPSITDYYFSLQGCQEGAIDSQYSILELITIVHRSCKTILAVFAFNAMKFLWSIFISLRNSLLHGARWTNILVNQSLLTP